MSAFWKRCRYFWVMCKLWIARHIFKLNRLSSIDLVDLEAPITEPLALYGDPIESKADEHLPGATRHTFLAGPFHEAVVVEWKKKVCLIVYWSAYADPNRDLEYMLEQYGEGIGWDVVEPGYLCVRKDGKVLLRCSVAPAISVESVEYLEAKRDVSETKDRPDSPKVS